MSEEVKKELMVVPVALRSGGDEGVTQIFIQDATQEQVQAWVNAAHRDNILLYQFRVAAEQNAVGVPLVININHILHVGKEFPRSVLALIQEPPSQQIPKPNLKGMN